MNLLRSLKQLTNQQVKTTHCHLNTFPGQVIGFNTSTQKKEKGQKIFLTGHNWKFWIFDCETLKAFFLGLAIPGETDSPSLKHPLIACISSLREKPHENSPSHSDMPIGMVNFWFDLGNQIVAISWYTHEIPLSYTEDIPAVLWLLTIFPTPLSWCSEPKV